VENGPGAPCQLRALLIEFACLSGELLAQIIEATDPNPMECARLRITAF
jgi:hypothetical protein